MLKYGTPEQKAAAKAYLEYKLAKYQQQAAYARQAGYGASRPGTSVLRRQRGSDGQRDTRAEPESRRTY